MSCPHPTACAIVIAMAPKREGRPILVRIPDDLLAKIDARCEKSGLSRAETIRRMLDYSIKTERKP